MAGSTAVGLPKAGIPPGMAGIPGGAMDGGDAEGPLEAAGKPGCPNGAGGPYRPGANGGGMAEGAGPIGCDGADCGW